MSERADLNYMTHTTRPTADKRPNQQALSAFRCAARQMKPTRHHRPGLWENMLGTVYAQNRAGEVRYFDYDWAEAIAFIGPVEDIRAYRVKMYDGVSRPNEHPVPPGKLIWFVKDKE